MSGSAILPASTPLLRLWTRQPTRESWARSTASPTAGWRQARGTSATLSSCSSTRRARGGGHSLDERRPGRHALSGAPPQVEFADVVVLNKTDLVSPAELAAVRALVVHLNPDAEIIESEFSRVPVCLCGGEPQGAVWLHAPAACLLAA